MKKRKIILLIILLYVISLILGIISIIKPIPESLKGIALVHIYGPIRIGERANAWSISPYGADRIIKKLKEIRENKFIKAVVLRINSPGGSVGAVQEIYREITKIRQKGKKVVVSMGDIATSGSYYLACPADKIIAEGGSLTGSIGVIMVIGNVEIMFTKIGIETKIIKSGEYKDIGSFVRKMTNEEKAILQGIINNAYEQFVRAIAEGRKMDIDKVRSLADGRIFTGEQALDVGLIDEIGNREDAIELAAKLAGIKKKPKIISRLESPLETIFGVLENSKFPNAFLEKIFPQQKIRFEYIWE